MEDSVVGSDDEELASQVVLKMSYRHHPCEPLPPHDAIALFKDLLKYLNTTLSIQAYLSQNRER